MLMTRYEPLIFNANFTETSSDGKYVAYRGELTICEGEVADAQGRRKPPTEVLKQVAVLGEGDSLKFLTGSLDTVAQLPDLIARFGADITADSVAAAMRQVLWRQLGIGAAMLLIGALLSWLFARLLAASLRRITRQIGQIAESRDLSATIRVASRDELGEMAQQLNHLFEVLRQSLGKARDVAEHNAALAAQFRASAGKVQEEVAHSARQMSDMASASGHMLTGHG